MGYRTSSNDYDLVCFTRQKSLRVKPYSVGDGFLIKCLETCWPHETLSGRHRLRCRAASAAPRAHPNHGDYFPIFTMGWGRTRERTKTLVKDEAEPERPDGRGQAFIARWAPCSGSRPAALKPLFDHDLAVGEVPA